MMRICRAHAGEGRRLLPRSVALPPWEGAPRESEGLRSENVRCATSSRHDGVAWRNYLSHDPVRLIAGSHLNSRTVSKLAGRLFGNEALGVGNVRVTERDPPRRRTVPIEKD